MEFDGTGRSGLRGGRYVATPFRAWHHADSGHEISPAFCRAACRGHRWPRHAARIYNTFSITLPVRELRSVSMRVIKREPLFRKTRPVKQCTPFSAAVKV